MDGLRVCQAALAFLRAVQNGFKNFFQPLEEGLKWGTESGGRGWMHLPDTKWFVLGR